MRQQLVDQPAVEVQAHLDGGAAPGRLHPGPGDGEAVGVQAQLRHQLHVVAVAVVVVDSDVTGVAAGRAARGMAEGVQMEGVRPSSRTAPSIWYAEVAAPQRKAGGKVTGVTGCADSDMEALP